ncbi:RNA-directed DNA polymerase, eukaryota, reverse transcriptase zinc-binding domain protein [Tanacetum coccineum]
MAWKVRFDYLPSRFNLSKRGLDILDICCPTCTHEAETTNHIFFSCTMVREIYLKIAHWWDVRYSNFSSYEDWYDWLSNLKMHPKRRDNLEGVCYIMWWLVWKFRNQSLFGTNLPLKANLFDEIVNRSLNQKRNGSKEIKVEEGLFNDGIGGNMDGVNKGVFGNEDCDDDNVIGTTVSKTVNFDTVNCDSDDADTVDSANNTNEKDNKTNGEDAKLLPTELNEEGSEVVVFDEELVSEGRRHGLKDIMAYGNGIFLFKFNNEQGLNYVIKSGPWMVNFKPMVVQKWDPDMDLDKQEQTKRPLWVKMMNIPLEAWTKRGISTLASRLKRPLIMDVVTSNMCQMESRKTCYARALVEVDASKGLHESIEIVYKSKDGAMNGSKRVNVTYDWKPPLCKHYKVFRHIVESYSIRPRTKQEKTDAEEALKNVRKSKSDGDGFKPKYVAKDKITQQYNREKKQVVNGGRSNDSNGKRKNDENITTNKYVVLGSVNEKGDSNMENKEVIKEYV